MWIACQEGHAEVVRLCLERGADLERANWQGLTPLDAARGRVAMVAWLARIRAMGGWAEPWYALVVLRELVARGRARRVRHSAFCGKDPLSDSLFPGDHSRRGQRLPDELFAIIVHYYGGQPLP